MTENEQVSPPVAMRVVSSTIAQDDHPAATDRRLTMQLRFANLLMRSLDINEVLRLFAGELSEALALDSIAYQNSALNIAMTFG